MRKFALAAVGMITLLGALAPAAEAGKPARELVPASDFTITGSCAFDVGVHVVANKEYGITFSDGATLVTGALKARLTNLSKPENSIDLNIPGPGLYTVSEDGALTIDARGPWLFFYPGVLLYAVGHSVFNVSSSGILSLTLQGGTSTDLCTALA